MGASRGEDTREKEDEDEETSGVLKERKEMRFERVVRYRKNRSLRGM